MRMIDHLRGDAWRLLNQIEVRSHEELRNNLANLTREDRAVLRTLYRVQEDEQVVHLAAQFHNIHR